MIKRIAFPTRWVDGAGTKRTGLAEFKLGPGPCGLTVSKIANHMDADKLTIRQTHVEGGHKDFIYRVRDITGRIEVEYVS